MRRRLAPVVAAKLGGRFRVDAIACASQIGSGALPLETVPSAGLCDPSGRRSALPAVRCRRWPTALRRLPVPVIGRIEDQALVLDLRCLEDEAGFVANLAALARRRRRTMIVGTAGHIDHGKTSLVRALTGVDTDRLKEEKARGISIDLGFAYLPAPDGAHPRLRRRARATRSSSTTCWPARPASTSCCWSSRPTTA